MLVKTKYLVEGCILAKDIQGLTNRPIMNKQTILDEELLKVLEGFLIEQVSVEKTLINGEIFHQKKSLIMNSKKNIKRILTLLVII